MVFANASISACSRYHGVDVLTKHNTSEVWNPACQFSVCYPHTGMNAGKHIFECIGNCGNMVFTEKRMGLEKSLGGLPRLFGLAGISADLLPAPPAPDIPAPAEPERNLNKKRKPSAPAESHPPGAAPGPDVPAPAEVKPPAWPPKGFHWPWWISAEDRELIDTFCEKIKLWACDFSFPQDLFGVTGALKIHDWYILCGALGAYVVSQCKSMDEKVRDTIIEHLLALEVLQLKRCPARAPTPRPFRFTALPHDQCQRG